MRYRKKPVVIEAFQMTRARRADNSKWPNWLHEAWNANHDKAGAVVIDADNEAVGEGGSGLAIVTLEGTMHVDFGDFIIQGVKGELYPCKPDIFEATYEAETDDPSFDEQADPA